MPTQIIVTLYLKFKDISNISDINNTLLVLLNKTHVFDYPQIEFLRRNGALERYMNSMDMSYISTYSCGATKNCS